MYNLYLYIRESTVRTFIGLTVLILMLGTGLHFAHATSWNVTNETQMNLDVSITGSQTTGIILSAPQLNGTSYTFSTLTGGILRIRYGAYREDIYFGSASVNATTKKVTLSGVVRNICPQNTVVVVSCGTGRSWGKGAIVELTVDARLLNLKANVDRANTYSATQTYNSGVVLVGPNYSLQVSTVTTAQRNAMTAANGLIVYNSDTGVLNQYIAGAWSAIGTTGVSDATETAAGKAEAATIKDQSGSVLTGDSGAPLFVQTRYLTSTGSNATQFGRLVTLGKVGVFTGSVLGTGNQYANSGKTHVSGTGSWVADTPTSNVFFQCSTATGSITLSGAVGETVLKQCNLTGSTISQGDVYAVNMNFYATNLGGSNSPTIKLKLNSTLISTPSAVMDPVNNTPFTFGGTVYITFMQNGANAKILTNGLMVSTSTGSTTTPKHFITKGTSPLNPFVYYDMTTNPSLVVTGQLGNTTAGNTLRLTSFSVMKLTNATQVRP